LFFLKFFFWHVRDEKLKNVPISFTMSAWPSGRVYQGENRLVYFPEIWQCDVLLKFI